MSHVGEQQQQQQQQPQCGQPCLSGSEAGWMVEQQQQQEQQRHASSHAPPLHAPLHAPLDASSPVTATAHYAACGKYQQMGLQLRRSESMTHLISSGEASAEAAVREACGLLECRRLSEVCGSGSGDCMPHQQQQQQQRQHEHPVVEGGAWESASPTTGLVRRGVPPSEPGAPATPLPGATLPLAAGSPGVLPAVTMVPVTLPWSLPGGGPHAEVEPSTPGASGYAGFSFPPLGDATAQLGGARPSLSTTTSSLLAAAPCTPTPPAQLPPQLCALTPAAGDECGEAGAHAESAAEAQYAPSAIISPFNNAAACFMATEQLQSPRLAGGEDESLLVLPAHTCAGRSAPPNLRGDRELIRREAAVARAQSQPVAAGGEGAAVSRATAAAAAAQLRTAPPPRHHRLAGTGAAALRTLSSALLPTAERPPLLDRQPGGRGKSFSSALSSGTQLALRASRGSALNLRTSGSIAATLLSSGSLARAASAAAGAAAAAATAQVPLRCRPHAELQLLRVESNMSLGSWTSMGGWTRPDYVPEPPESASLPPGVPQLRPEELRRVRELGRGHFGMVWLATWRGARVAVKELFDGGLPQSATRGWAGRWDNGPAAEAAGGRSPLEEAALLASLRHPNIVGLYGCVTDPGCAAMVLEYMPGGSLRDGLQDLDARGLCGRAVKAAIALEAARGMDFLHSRNVVHLDLKCDNLLCDVRDPCHPVVKIGDLGLSKEASEGGGDIGMIGTLPFMAPELFTRSSNGGGASPEGGEKMLTEMVDVYSFGIVMWEMWVACRERPYRGMPAGDVLAGVLTGDMRPEVPVGCDPEWERLMRDCWAAVPSERPSFADVCDRLEVLVEAWRAEDAV